MTIRISDIRLVSACTGTIEVGGGPRPAEPSDAVTRFFAALLWSASIEAYGAAFLGAGARVLPGDPDGLADAQWTLWTLAMAHEGL